MEEDSARTVLLRFCRLLARCLALLALLLCIAAALTRTTNWTTHLSRLLQLPCSACLVRILVLEYRHEFNVHTVRCRSLALTL